MTILQPTGRQPLAGDRRDLHPRLFDRVVARLVTTDGFKAPDALRAVDNAWAFLQACVEAPELRLSPTPVVDAAWHASLLHSRDYFALCEALGAPGVIHHEPTEDDAPGSGEGAGAAVTVNAFRDLGIPYDDDLWFQPTASSPTASPTAVVGLTAPIPLRLRGW